MRLRVYVVADLYDVIVLGLCVQEAGFPARAATAPLILR
jgi:hypothetical protein